MKPDGFERFKVDHADLRVSICRACLQIVAVAHKASGLASAEELHDCPHPRKKPPASVLVPMRHPWFARF